MRDHRTKLKALAALVQADTRQTVQPDGTATPSLCAFVSRRVERVGELQAERPALILVVEGVKEVVQAGRRIRLRSGEALTLPVGWRGSVVNEPDALSGHYRALFIGFPPDLIVRAHRAHPGWSAGSAQASRQQRITRLSPMLLDSVLHLAESLAGDDAPRHLVEHRAMEVLLVLVDQGALPLAPPAASSSVSDAVCALLKWRPSHRWTAEEIGRELGLSNATLRRRLDEEGTALRTLFLAERMAYAHALLSREGLTVVEAAEAAGYGSRAHFGQQFKKTFGYAPSACRQSEPAV